MNFKKILLPLDGSELAERALELAMCIAEETLAEIVLFQVVVPLDIDLILPEASLTHAEEEAQRYLAAIRARFADTGVNIRTDVVVSSGVATAVNKYAQENDIDLIVMSGHGRSGVFLWTYGSVTEKVLLGTDRTTMIV